MRHDGFSVKSKFLYTEMGIIYVGNAKPKSFFFDVEQQWDALSAKDRKECMFTKQNPQAAVRSAARS